jgi:hypothetical protein
VATAVFDKRYTSTEMTNQTLSNYGRLQYQSKTGYRSPGSFAGAVEEMMKSEEAISWKCAWKRRNIPHDSHSVGFRIRLE